MFLDPKMLGAARRMEGLRLLPAMVEEQRRVDIDGLIETPSISKDYIAGYHDALRAFCRSLEAALNNTED